MLSQDQEPSFKNFFVPLTTVKAIRIITIIGIIVFFNSLFNGFVWDDIYQIVSSPIVQNANYSYYFTHTIAPFYRPLMFVSYIIIYQLFGLNAFFYHLFQLLLHISNAIFVFILLKHFSKKIVLSIFLALLFLIHPINAETVGYIADFQEVLYLFFGLLATTLICKGSHIKHVHIYIVTLLLLSIFSKETGLLFVLMYPLYYFLFDKTHFKKSLLFGGFAMIVYSLTRYLLVGLINVTYYNIIPPNVILTASLNERLLTIPKIIASYITTLIFPTNLSIQYWVVRSITFSDFILPLIIDVVFFVVLIKCGLYLLQNNKKVFYIYLFFAIWFCLGLIPHLQLFPLDKTFATRWFYFSFVGLLGMLMSVLSLIKFNLSQSKKMFLTLGICIVYGIFALTTIISNTKWYNGVTLFEHETAKQKNIYELEYNYGFALMQGQQYDKAIKHFETAMKLVPNNTVALGNLCFSYLHASRLNDAKKCYKHLLNLDKNSTANFGPLILVYLLQNEPQDAKNLAYKGLKKNPNDGLLWRSLGLAAYKLDDKNLAQSAFEKSYKLVPNDVTYYYLNQIKNNQQIEMREL